VQEVPVNIDRLVEKVVYKDVPVDRVQIREVPVPVEKIVVKEVEVPVERIVDRVIEKPVEKVVYQDRIVYQVNFWGLIMFQICRLEWRDALRHCWAVEGRNWVPGSMNGLGFRSTGVYEWLRVVFAPCDGSDALPVQDKIVYQDRVVEVPVETVVYKDRVRCGVLVAFL
jgi:hypothetical protein